MITPLRNRTPSPLFTVLVLLSLLPTASRLISLPLNRVIEARFCLEYFSLHDPSVISPDGYVDEDICKAINVVQERLGWMNGAIDCIMVLCDMVMTAPMGYVISKFGARVALCMNVFAGVGMMGGIGVVGYFRNVFPVQAFLVAPLFVLIGGGNCVLLAITLTLASSIAGDERQRTEYVAYLTSVDYVTSLFSPSLAAVLMQKSMWLPFWVGFGLIALSFPLIVLIPQARSPEKDAMLRPGSTVRVSERAPLISRNMPESFLNDDDEFGRSKSITCVIRSFFTSYFTLVANRRNFQILLGAFCLLGLSNSAMGLLLIYISKRYQWPFARVGYLFTLKAAVNVFVLVICVPGFTRVMARKTRYAPAQVDMLGSKIALATLAVGALAIGMSSEIWMLIVSLMVYAVGSILPVFVYSLVRYLSLADSGSGSTSDGRPIALAVLCHSAGRLIGIPLLTALWVRGIEVGGRGMGLPFFVSAIGYITTLTVLRCVRL